jgi:plasmid stability protein
MATLYAENVPDDLYDALRKQARENRRSMAAELVSLLRENVVTSKEVRSRQQFRREAELLRSRRPASSGPFPTTEEMQRQDRSR